MKLSTKIILILSIAAILGLSIYLGFALSYKDQLKLNIIEWTIGRKIFAYVLFVLLNIVQIFTIIFIPKD